jgi:hypothetical protein
MVDKLERMAIAISKELNGVPWKSLDQVQRDDFCRAATSAVRELIVADDFILDALKEYLPSAFEVSCENDAAFQSMWRAALATVLPLDRSVKD